MKENNNKTVAPSDYVYTHTTSGKDIDLDLAKFEEVKNAGRGEWWIKPEGGLWLSVNNGWERWCENGEPEWVEGHKRYQIFLREDANILLIDKVEDLNNLPKNKNIPFESKTHIGLDFEELAKEYDGVQVMINGDKTPNISYENRLYEKLLGWDCDSTVLFNKECIEKIVEIEPIPEREIQPEGGRF